MTADHPTVLTGTNCIRVSWTRFDLKGVGCADHLLLRSMSMTVL
jgi:hypothetical protein